MKSFKTGIWTATGCDDFQVEYTTQKKASKFSIGASNLVFLEAQLEERGPSGATFGSSFGVELTALKLGGL